MNPIAFLLRCGLATLLIMSAVSPAHGAGERELVARINAYRAYPDTCQTTGGAPSSLVLRANLQLPAGYSGGLREGLRRSGYQAAAVRAIRLAGPQTLDAAFVMLRTGYCQALLDSQYTDIGISHKGEQWQVLLARPLLDTQLADPRATAQTLLAQVNAARAKPRLCGRIHFAAARPLAWSPALAAAALGHSRAMAEGGYFSHQDRNGTTPYARARAEGYRGRQVGENIAAGHGSPAAAVAGWLASPGHCANLMNPVFTQMGAGYQTAPDNEAGIYWTMLFGAP